MFTSTWSHAHLAPNRRGALFAVHPQAGSTMCSGHLHLCHVDRMGSVWDARRKAVSALRPLVLPSVVCLSIAVTH